MFDKMNVQRIAAFSDGNRGGNPAGVVICDAMPDTDIMQALAADIGYSETVFACLENDGWRVRYFSPETEVPFCGHATIALGAALALAYGNGIFSLTLNNATISVEGKCEGHMVAAALQSPPTQSKPADPDLISNALSLFGYAQGDLDLSIPSAIVQAGATHLVLSLKNRKLLASMKYDLATGRELMKDAGLTTIILAWPETPQLFHTRNPFASGGVYEDPATGAATAAFAGYLRDIAWPHAGCIDIIQGEDMRMRSLLRAEIPPERGASIRVSGTARLITEANMDV